MSIIEDRAAIIAQILCLVSDTSKGFNLAMNPTSDDVSVIFDSSILPEDVEPLCSNLTKSGFTRFDVDEYIVFQSFVAGLVMTNIRINIKKNDITLTFNT